MNLHVPKANYDYNSIKLICAKPFNQFPEDIKKVKSEKEVFIYYVYLNINVSYTASLSIEASNMRHPAC